MRLSAADALFWRQRVAAAQALPIERQKTGPRPYKDHFLVLRMYWDAEELWQICEGTKWEEQAMAAILELE